MCALTSTCFFADENNAWRGHRPEQIKCCLCSDAVYASLNTHVLFVGDIWHATWGRIEQIETSLTESVKG